MPRPKTPKLPKAPPSKILKVRETKSKVFGDPTSPLRAEPLSMSSELAQAKAKERKRRQDIIAYFTSRLFKEQQAFALDESRFKSLLCSRRSGKTTCAAVMLLMEAMLHPGTKLLYLGVTKDSAEKAIIQIFQEELNLAGVEYSYKQNEKRLCIGKAGDLSSSQIIISGLDCSKNEHKKLLGSKYWMLVIDEVQDIKQDIDFMIDSTFAPALSDYISQGGGKVCCMGTPGETLSGFWFQLTNPESEQRRLGWSYHHWTVSDNPRMVGEFLSECERLRLNRGDTFKEDPIFQRQWLGRWVLTLGDKVYSYDPRRNNLGPTPEELSMGAEISPDELALKRSLLMRDQRWTYLLGIDLGWHDDCAFVVGAYHANDPHFYIVESQKYNHQTLDVVANTIEVFWMKYNCQRMIIDTGGGAKQGVESMIIKHRMPLIAAKKQDKNTMIARFNSDLFSGLTKVIPETNQALIKEWQELGWTQAKRAVGVFVENSKQANHLCDAAIYAFLDSLHTHYKEPIKIIKDAQAMMVEQLLAKQKQKQQERDWMFLDPEEI